MIFYTSPYYLLFAVGVSWPLWLSPNRTWKKIVLGLGNLAVMLALFIVRKWLAVIFAALSVELLVILGICGLIERRVETPARARFAGWALFISLVGLIGSAVYATGSLPRHPLWFHPLGRASATEFLCVTFFLIRAIHLVVDRYQGRIENPTPSDVLGYLFFFPLFLSGPVAKFQDYVGDLDAPVEWNWEKAYGCLRRVTIGVFKKFVLANSLTYFSADQLSEADILNLPKIKVLLAFYLYTAVLYLDFSGYTDIAIGVAGWMGFRCPENFRRPLAARNLQDFWNRWHISFVDWLKEYLFIPISTFLFHHGIKNFYVVVGLSTWCTFVLAGIWHGLSINYLYYGLYHSLGLTFFVLVRPYLSQVWSALPATMGTFLSRFLTFNFVSFGWFFFLDKMGALRGFWLAFGN